MKTNDDTRPAAGQAAHTQEAKRWAERNAIYPESAALLAFEDAATSDYAKKQTNAAAVAACQAIREARDDLFCGLPLCVNGKPIDHTKLNRAFDLAETALQSHDHLPH